MKIEIIETLQFLCSMKSLIST